MKEFGKIIQTGAERICYANPSNPNTCFKVSKKSRCKETKREIKYFKFLKKHNIHASFLPTFFGEFEQDDVIGFEQELIKNPEDLEHHENAGQSIRVLDYLAIASEEQLGKLESLLKSIKAQMLEMNIIVSDMHPGNMMVILDAKNEILRLVIIDGFGSPEFIPYPQYIRFFGRKKIERQWKKFWRNYYIKLKEQRGA